MTTKEQLKSLCASIIDMAEEEINEHLKDEKNQTQASVNGSIVAKLKCDSDLSRVLVKNYILMRPEIESVKGPNGGIRPVLVKVITPSTVPIIEAKEETVVIDNSKLNTNTALPTPKVEVKLAEDTKELPYNLTAKAHKEAKEAREKKEEELGIERTDTLTTDIA